ncbi:DUF397 domain-containing protein [Streptomyces sp. NPDC048258]|uniref:DUF397 domain-containing protein n=1 Tax=Streptomyces sp. NPDC048258 TaxID=3365527 RepID=UPI00371DD53D
MHQYQWQRSSRCASGDSCVYVTTAPGDCVLVAESPAPTRVLRTTPAAWAALLGAVRARRL